MTNSTPLKNKFLDNVVVYISKEGLRLQPQALSISTGVPRSTIYRWFPQGFQSIVEHLCKEIVIDVAQSFSLPYEQPSFTFESAMAVCLARLETGLSHNRLLCAVQNDAYIFSTIMTKFCDANILSRYVLTVLALYTKRSDEGFEEDLVECAQMIAFTIITELIFQQKFALNLQDEVLQVKLALIKKRLQIDTKRILSKLAMPTSFNPARYSIGNEIPVLT